MVLKWFVGITNIRQQPCIYVELRQFVHLFIEKLIQTQLDWLYFVSRKIFLLSQVHFPDKYESEQAMLTHVTVF